MEFQPNDRVVYKSAGVCEVLSVETQSMDGETEVLYYKLKPVSDVNSTYYIPVASEKEKLRRLLTKEEVLKLIESMSEDPEKKVWSDNRRERREIYTQILRGDDQKALVQLISSLYLHKQSSEARGRRFSSMDEMAMKNAENLMIQEFAAVLEINPDEVRQLISQHFDAEK